MSDLELQIEALLIASSKPISISALEKEAGRSLTPEIMRLCQFWEPRGFNVSRAGDELRFEPNKDVMRALTPTIVKTTLSPTAQEILAYIAVNQPVTLNDINKGRNTSSFKGTIKDLLDSGLVSASSRKGNSGKAIVYKTTPQFLETFNLTSLDDIPTSTELDELSLLRELDSIEDDFF